MKKLLILLLIGAIGIAAVRLYQNSQSPELSDRTGSSVSAAEDELLHNAEKLKALLDASQKTAEKYQTKTKE